MEEIQELTVNEEEPLNYELVYVKHEEGNPYEKFLQNFILINIFKYMT